MSSSHLKATYIKKNLHACIGIWRVSISVHLIQHFYDQSLYYLMMSYKIIVVVVSVVNCSTILNKLINTQGPTVNTVSQNRLHL